MNLGTFGQLSMRLETLEPAPEPVEVAQPAWRWAATPTWLTATCTNCGVTTEVDIYGRCESCGTPNEEVYGS